MYLKSFIFLLCAYSFISAKPVSVNLSSDGNMAERPTPINRLSVATDSQPKPTQTTDKRQAGDSGVNSGDGLDNGTASGQEVGGDTVCNLGNYTSLFNAIQLNPLYAFSVMAELQHAEAVSRRKRQQTGSNANIVAPGQICNSVLSTLNDDSIHVACPSSGHNNVWYQCEFLENRYPRYLIQATSCRSDRSCGSQCPTNGECRDHNATVTIAEHTGDCTWQRISTEIRLGCQCRLHSQ